MRRGEVVIQKVEDGLDETRLVQEKIGNYNEGVFQKTHRSPLKQASSFTYHLRRYLKQRDKRFGKIYIHPVAAFTETTDIEAVHDLDKGIIYARELPEFFERYSNAALLEPPSWVREGLHRVPTWDMVQTTDNEWINGMFVGSELVFRGRDKVQHHLPYAEIQSIELTRRGRFSAYDTLSVHYVNGHIRQYRCSRGVLLLRRFGEEVQEHKLRNLNRIIVGIANKPL